MNQEIKISKCDAEALVVALAHLQDECDDSEIWALFGFKRDKLEELEKMLEEKISAIEKKATPEAL